MKGRFRKALRQPGSRAAAGYLWESPCREVRKTPNGGTKNFGHLLLLLHPPAWVLLCFRSLLSSKGHPAAPVSLQSSQLHLQNTSDLSVMICSECAEWNRQLWLVGAGCPPGQQECLHTTMHTPLRSQPATARPAQNCFKREEKSPAATFGLSWKDCATEVLTKKQM